MDIWHILIVAVVVIVAVVGAVVVVGLIVATRRRPDARLRARVDDLEARLSAVERTLNEIP